MARICSCNSGIPTFHGDRKRSCRFCRSKNLPPLRNLIVYSQNPSSSQAQSKARLNSDVLPRPWLLPVRPSMGRPFAKLRNATGISVLAHPLAGEHVTQNWRAAMARICSCNSGIPTFHGDRRRSCRFCRSKNLPPLRNSLFFHAKGVPRSACLSLKQARMIPGRAGKIKAPEPNGSGAFGQALYSSPSPPCSRLMRS